MRRISWQRLRNFVACREIGSCACPYLAPDIGSTRVIAPVRPLDEKLAKALDVDSCLEGADAVLAKLLLRSEANPASSPGADRGAGRPRRTSSPRAGRRRNTSAPEKHPSGMAWRS